MDTPWKRLAERGNSMCKGLRREFLLFLLWEDSVGKYRDHRANELWSSCSHTSLFLLSRKEVSRRFQEDKIWQ